MKLIRQVTVMSSSLKFGVTACVICGKSVVPESSENEKICQVTSGSVSLQNSVETALKILIESISPLVSVRPVSATICDDSPNFHCETDTSYKAERNFVAFCSICESFLGELESVKGQLSVLEEQFNRIKFTLVALLLSSTYGDAFRSSETDAKSASSASFQMLQICKLRRQLRFQYSPKVKLKRLPEATVEPLIAKLNGAELHSESMQNEDDGDEWADDGQASFESNPLADRPKTSTVKSKKPYRGIHKLTEIAPNQFMYAEKYKIKVEEDGHHCGECPGVFDGLWSITRHIRLVHMKKTQYTRKFTKPRKFVETGPNEFLFGGKYRVTFSDGNYHCGICQFQRPLRDQIRKHIHMVHEGKTKTRSSMVEVSPNEFLYNNKYPFRYIKKDEVYACGLCDHRHGNLKSMFPHIRQNHYSDEDKQKFSAVQVGEAEFIYAEKYRITLNEGQYVCDLCGYSRMAITDIYTHIRMRHAATEADSVSGQGEGTKIKKSQSLPQRTKISNSFTYAGIPYTLDVVDNKFICSVCGAKVGWRCGMTDHIKTLHLEPQSFVCELCGKTLSSQRCLRHHKKTHSEVTFICPHCPKTFKTKRNYRLHVAVHEKGEDVKTYQCEYCGKKFWRQGHLRKHVRLHTGEKPCICQICEERFSDTGKLWYHRKTVHGICPQKSQTE